MQTNATRPDSQIALGALNAFGAAELAVAKAIVLHGTSLEAGVTDLQGCDTQECLDLLFTALHALTGGDEEILCCLDENGDYSEQARDEHLHAMFPDAVWLCHDGRTGSVRGYPRR